MTITQARLKPSNVAAQTITGTVVSGGAAAVAGQTVTLTDNGTTLGTAVVQSNGSFSASVILPNQGANAIVASVTDSYGNTGASAAVVDTLDTVRPTVSSIVASPSSGDKNTGNVVLLQLTLSRSVVVTGTPALSLNDGGGGDLQSGSGTNVLTFAYTVANGQNTANLAVTGNNLNGASVAIADAYGNAADLSGADVTFPGLAIGATVRSVVSSPASGDLGPGKVVTPFAVTMTEAVTITGGTPALSLNDGGTATYKSGSGTNVLNFSYTVGALGSGQNAAALAINGVNLNGATVYDSNNPADTADLTGVTAFTAGPQVDTTAPTVSSVADPANGDLSVGAIITLTVMFSEAVVVSGSPYLTLNDGAHATFVGGSGSNTLTFSYVVAAGQNIADLTVTGMTAEARSRMVPATPPF